MYEPLTPSTPSEEPQPAAPATPSSAVPAPLSPEPAIWTTPATPVPSAPAIAQRRSVGPGFVLGAVFVSALLASGGTFLAVNGADHTTSARLLAATATQAPAGGSATQAPAAGTTSPAAPAGGQSSVADIFKAVSPAVVTIVADGVAVTDPTTGQSGTGTATGSGVIFDANGLILTNHHVVAGDPSKITVNLKDGRSFDASIYGVDTLTDLAIVKVDQTGLPTAPIGDSSTIQVGQEAIAIGSPLGE